MRRYAPCPPKNGRPITVREKKSSTNQRTSVIRLLIFFPYSMLRARAWVADSFTRSLDLNVSQSNHYIKKGDRCAPGLHLFVLANARHRTHFRTQFPSFFFRLISLHTQPNTFPYIFVRLISLHAQPNAFPNTFPRFFFSLHFLTHATDESAQHLNHDH